jgi:hypothetical protein
MQISAKKPRCGERSQVHAHGKGLTRDGAARRFHAQPAGTVFGATKDPPGKRCRRHEQD